ncbi:uncharacterized protein KY384_001920 [Bacidia gigantensis]|uniref:uncharacterized protein n=1 Tax=Bacidia gigantensis TaxID=2732470 RepID=UPI001D0425AD|nr:uncharacterized protein KY384_001920 [Bacidia gigantensis]KAG8533137.1 hypothetical protein KY384_001920 [Bacidia gigantensis]
MSGRSAYVRAKNNQQAGGGGRQTSFKQYSDFAPDEPYIYGYTGPPHGMTRPVASSSNSYVSHPPPHLRRRSHSSAGSVYGHPGAPHLHKPRPIVIASAIEKSDFRTHLDGMSSTLRGKLGGLMKVNKKDATPSDKPRRRPETSSADSEFEFNSRSTELTTPSVGAVPSLTNSTAPSEGLEPGKLSTHHSYSLPTRQRQTQEAVIHKIRRFEGGGKLPQLGWKSLSNAPSVILTATQNPELWDESGDTFVYMYMRGSKTKPPPSFRIDSRVIYESGPAFFIDQLENVQEPEGWPRFAPNGDDMDMDDPTEYHGEVFGGARSPTMLRSDTSASDVIRPAGPKRQWTQKAPPGINYELYIPWPGAETGIHSTIWHITTRNYFAVMYDASALVGTTLLEALTKIFERVKANPDYLDRSVSRVAWITDYIVRHKFDDVRNNPSYAASLLAFSEIPDIQWREGYIEAFVHCVGMLDLGLQTIPEWKYITPQTKMFLQNASMEIEERIHRAQGWLLTFDFTELWPVTVSTQSAARGCFDRLRKWFCKYYENAFLHWPPTHDMTWLTRDMVVRLADDFYSLYDYLVDRDIIFDGSEYRPGQKWAITSRSGQNFRADSYELPITDMLTNFDNSNNLPHIPHPYPLTPTSVPVASKPKSAFSLKKGPTQAEQLAQTRRKALSYAEASNVYTLRDQYMHTDLVTNFIRFEQSDSVEGLDPFEARRGRWVLIYGILQILATISVDSPNLRYRDGAQYHLCPQMKGVVPWAERGAPPEEEPEHMRSHCWTVPHTWGPAQPKARPNAHKPILWGQYGDGRSRYNDDSATATVKHEGSLPAFGAAATGKTVTDVNTSRKRAEEWVNSTPTNAGDVTSETGMTIDTADQMALSERTGSAGNAAKSTKSGRETSPGSVNDIYENESLKLEARRRRAKVHGFTDFEPPKEW